MKLFVNAYNVHSGGGKSLLIALLNSHHHSGEKVFLLDSRLILPDSILDTNKVIIVQPTIKNRFMAEVWLYKNVKKDDIVLCFGNLPPIFKLAGYVFVFIQNKYLIENKSLSKFSIKSKLRIWCERKWLSWRKFNLDTFIVQTPTMENAINKWQAQHRISLPVSVAPFVEQTNRLVAKPTAQINLDNKSFDFAYIASGEPHKNHQRLVEAWCLLADDGIYPTLCFTIDKALFPTLCEWIEEKRVSYQLSLHNFGSLTHSEVTQLYFKIGALIYPSQFESFGLPLIEARCVGLQVLAPELDYVRDIIQPAETFDADSSLSIARAVKRYLNSCYLTVYLMSFDDFLTTLISMGK
jgi:glycosyltransferase involved in cell wall biosynthesis